MPILLEGTAATDEQLNAMLADHLGGIQALLQQIAQAPAGRMRDPLGAHTLRELGEQVNALADQARAPGAPRELRVLAVNLSYAAMLASIDLYKSLLGLPKAPGSGRAGPSSSSAPG